MSLTSIAPGPAESLFARLPSVPSDESGIGESSFLLTPDGVPLVDRSWLVLGEEKNTGAPRLMTVAGLDDGDPSTVIGASTEPFSDAAGLEDDLARSEVGNDEPELVNLSAIGVGVIGGLCSHSLAEDAVNPSPSSAMTSCNASTTSGWSC